MRELRDFLTLVLMCLGALPTSQAEPITPFDCSTVLHGRFNETTRHFGLLKELLTSDQVDEPTKELIRNREFQLAVWKLNQNGQKELGLQLSRYLTETLLESTVLGMVPIGQGFSNPMVVTFANGMKAVFKPETTHWARKINVDSASPNGERLAYAFDQILELNMVVTSVDRTINGRRGRLITWVKDDDSRTSPDQLRLLQIFDYLINNKDRHPGNYLSYQGSIIAIDHNISFVSEDHHGNHGPYPQRAFNGEPIPEPFLSNLKNRLTPQMIEFMLNGWVSSDVIELVKKRRLEILDYQENLIIPQNE